MNKTWKTSFLCLFLCLLVFSGSASMNAAGIMPQNPESTTVEPAADGSCDLEHVTITIFDHTLANRDHHALATLILPSCKRVVACQMVITEHLDRDDVCVRATLFLFDVVNENPEKYNIGTCRTGRDNVVGDIIAPGQTVTYTYDMSNVQFSNAWPQKCSWYKNFIPQDENDTSGYLSPGMHVIEVWISSYDRYSGELPADTWITLTLHLVFEDVVGELVDDLVDAIDSSSDDCWRTPAGNRKATMINKLFEVKDLSCSDNFEEAYDKLLHDIKPKLTGLKTDENENSWGNGIFDNPWVICSELQEAFKSTCNELLSQLVKCIT